MEEITTVDLNSDEMYYFRHQIPVTIFRYHNLLTCNYDYAKKHVKQLVKTCCKSNCLFKERKTN